MSEELIDYGTWGRRFFATAVTIERVLDGVNVIAGRPIEVGPLGVGPGRIAKVMARGSIGTATGERSGADPLAFHVSLPVSLKFSLDLGMDKQNFDAQITVPLLITAHGRADLAIALEVTPPEPGQVVVLLKAQGLRASLTSKAANVEGELRRFVAKYVAREIDQPRIKEATVIDVGAAIERAAASLAPREESPVADDLTQGLPAAMEAELEHTAQLLMEPDEDTSEGTGEETGAEEQR